MKMFMKSQRLKTSLPNTGEGRDWSDSDEDTPKRLDRKTEELDDVELLKVFSFSTGSLPRMGSGPSNLHSEMISMSASAGCSKADRTPGNTQQEREKSPHRDAVKFTRTVLVSVAAVDRGTPHTRRGLEESR